MNLSKDTSAIAQPLSLVATSTIDFEHAQSIGFCGHGDRLCSNSLSNWRATAGGDRRSCPPSPLPQSAVAGLYRCTTRLSVLSNGKTFAAESNMIEAIQYRRCT